QKSTDPRILSLSPALNLSKQWLGVAPAYMMATYSMSLAALGIGAQYEIPSTCLWPTTTIHTAAVKYDLGGSYLYERSRTAEVSSDSANAVLTADRTQYASKAV